MRAASPGTSGIADPWWAEAVKRRPRPSTHSIETTLSLVRPQAVAWGPQALLPTMPPMEARFWLEGSGPKRRPWARAASCRVEPMQPGSTVAVRARGSMLSTRFMWREKSMTAPGPMELPAHEVPPPRVVMGTPRPRAISRARSTWSVSRGKTTTAGGIR